MRLFVDTNIIIEYIEHRLQYDAVRKIRAQWGQAPLRPWAVIHSEIVELREQVSRYLSDTDWEKWEQNNIEP